MKMILVCVKYTRHHLRTFLKIEHAFCNFDLHFQLVHIIILL
jgi:hypothetical protein